MKTHGKAATFALVFAAALAAAQTADEVKTTFRVRYAVSDSVYIEGGRAAGLAEGMKLTVRPRRSTGPAASVSAAQSASPTLATRALAGDDPADGDVAELKVTSVAETSAVCEILSSRRALATGDVAVLSQPDTQALVEKRALSSTRKYPAVVSFTEGDPLDEAVREQVPRPPLPEVNRATGRIGLDYSGTRSGSGASALQSSQLGMVVRADITRIGGTHWNLSGYWRGRLDSRSAAGQPATLQDLVNRTYHISLSYDNPQSRWVAGFGRMYLPWASSLETIDGGYLGRKIGGVAVTGLFAGTTPDPTSWNYDPDRRLAGSFVNFQGGSYDGVRYTGTFGVGVSALRWILERPFAFTENNLSIKNRFSIYSALQFDQPRVAPEAQPVDAGLSRAFISLRWQPHPRVALNVNDTYFRDVPTYDPQLVGTGLLDKYLFQGISGGIRVEMPAHLALYTDIGRSSRTGDASDSWNRMYGATLGRIWRTGLRLDARYSRFNSVFARGEYRSLSLSRNFGETLRLEVQGGRQAYLSTITTDTGSRFLHSNVEWSPGSRYFLQAGFNAQRGLAQDYDQWYLTFGYRFDNRMRAAQEAANANTAKQP